MPLPKPAIPQAQASKILLSCNSCASLLVKDRILIKQNEAAQDWLSRLPPWQSNCNDILTRYSKGTSKLPHLWAFSSARRCRMRGSCANASFTNCFIRRASSFLAGSLSLLLNLSIHLHSSVPVSVYPQTAIQCAANTRHTDRRAWRDGQTGTQTGQLGRIAVKVCRNGRPSRPSQVVHKWKGIETLNGTHRQTHGNNGVLGKAHTTTM